MKGKGNRSDFSRKLLICLFIDVCLSAYITGYMQTLLKNSYHASMNPIVMIRFAMEYGVWWSTFFGVFVAIALVFAYAILAIENDKKSMDKMGRLFKLSKKRQSYGDSHFEDESEFSDAAVVQSQEEAYGTILGQMDSTGTRLINFRMDKEQRLNSHMNVIGASGSGKTYTFSKPFCFQCVKRRESIVLTDPDGGLYRDMAGYFEDQGYVVRRLDLKNLLKSDGWHCLRAINKETAEVDAQIFAQTIMSNLVDDPSSIFFSGPMSLLKALILYVVLDENRPEEEKNIGAVYEMLQQPDGEAYLDRTFDETAMSEAQKPCLGPYRSFKQGSPNLRGNLITNLSVQLQLLQSNTVKTVLSTDDIDLLLPGKQPCAYFCIFPDDHSTFKFIVSLFFSMLFFNLIGFADRRPDGRLPVPVNFLLDEFPSIGALPDWDSKMATIRKRAINAVMIYQNIMQLQARYDNSWSTIFSNCATLLVLSVNDDDTAALLTKRIGDTTIEAKTEQHSAMESFLKQQHKNSTGEGRRSLLSHDELYKLNKDDSLIIFQGHNPIWAKKYPFVLHSDAKKMRPILLDDIPDITEIEQRKIRKEEETARIEQFNKEHPEFVNFDRSYNGKCNTSSHINTQEIIKKKIRQYAEKAQDYLRIWTAKIIKKIDDFIEQNKTNTVIVEEVTLSQENDVVIAKEECFLLEEEPLFDISQPPQSEPTPEQDEPPQSEPMPKQDEPPQSEPMPEQDEPPQSEPMPEQDEPPQSEPTPEQDEPPQSEPKQNNNPFAPNSRTNSYNNKNPFNFSSEIQKAKEAEARKKGDTKGLPKNKKREPKNT